MPHKRLHDNTYLRCTESKTNTGERKGREREAGRGEEGYGDGEIVALEGKIMTKEVMK